MAEDLIIIGGGEHARVVIDAAKLLPDKWHILGFVDPEAGAKTADQCYLPRLGGDLDLPKLLSENPNVKLVLGIGKNLALRREITENLNLPDEKWAVIIHPTAVVSNQAKIAEGSVVFSKVVIQAGAEIGKHAIINSGVLIEHDVTVGAYSHVTPGVVTGGGAHIGEEVLVGLGAKIRDHLNIGSKVVVGTGAVVVSDIPEGKTVVGIPAKQVGDGKSYRELNIDNLCIYPETNLMESMNVIGRSGAMISLVTDKQRKLLGIVTDGDIRRALLNKIELDQPVKRIMIKNFHYIAEDSGRLAALDKMKAVGVNQMPVLDEKSRVVGLHLWRNFIGVHHLPNVAVIMAGGKGTRLKPYTDKLPKPMVKVAGRPILEHLICHLAGSKIKKVYLAINEYGSVIEDYFQNGEAHGCQIHYLRETEPLGTAGALSLIPSIPDKPFLVLNGDLITNFNVESMIRHHQRDSNMITIGAHNYKINIPYGVLRFDESKLVTIEEKPDEQYTVNGGIYVLDPQLLKCVPKNQNFDMTSLIESCFEKNEKVGAYLIESDWMDIGRPVDLAIARGLM